MGICNYHDCAPGICKGKCKLYDQNVYNQDAIITVLVRKTSDSGKEV